MMIVNKLRGKTNNLVILQYFYVCQTVITPVVQNFSPISFKGTMTPSFFLAIVLLVCSAYFTQNLVTRATMLKKASVIMPFGYISIVLSFIVDIVF